MNQTPLSNAAESSPVQAAPSNRFLGAWVVGALVAASGYATLRYVVLGPVAWQQLPLYVANKSFALAGLVLLVAAQCYRAPAVRRRLGCWGAALVTAHLAASVVLLQPGYFPGWFTPQGQFTPAAGLALLSGVLAAVALAALWLVSLLGREGSGSSGGSLLLGGGSLVLGLSALHLVSMGASGWLTPSRWHGSLPPITLLGFLLVLGALLWRGLPARLRRRG